MIRESMKLRRLPDWQPRLVEFIERERRTPFERGQHDCITFGAGAVEAITGHNVMSGVRYASLREAAKHVRMRGARMRSAIESTLIDVGAEEIPTSFAMIGDIAIIYGAETEHSVGVRWQNGVIGRSRDGVAYVPLTDIISVWRI